MDRIVSLTTQVGLRFSSKLRWIRVCGGWRVQSLGELVRVDWAKKSKPARPATWSHPMNCFRMWTLESPVKCVEIFDYTHNPTLADYLRREELSNIRVCIDIPNGVPGTKDWEGLRREFAGSNWTLKIMGNTLSVCGCPPTNGDDHRREIEARVAKHRRSSSA
ncbi:uncharacterized protein [Physcomitrium patens]|uniref:Uncharacterized protein n=2 Tax=Physcomitrium patens TaxID=3218 RepID=A0A7I4E4Q7_PHYPA|nr:uncharacterized protein LOC112283397 isoform X2 [Physcomitrium patens]|eukprot:XP_024377785.1 uncharacterized protein LOC112283397 isoform X2 [Physcomitrella patens]